MLTSWVSSLHYGVVISMLDSMCAIYIYIILILFWHEFLRLEVPVCKVALYIIPETGGITPAVRNLGKRSSNISI
jgi:hypothetical protein